MADEPSAFLPKNPPTGEGFVIEPPGPPEPNAAHEPMPPPDLGPARERAQRRHRKGHHRRRREAEGAVAAEASPPPPPSGPPARVEPDPADDDREPALLARLDAPPARRRSRRLLAGGVAAAIAVGVVLGVLAQPDLIPEPRPMAPAAPKAETASEPPRMQVAVREAPQSDAARAAQPQPAEPDARVEAPSVALAERDAAAEADAAAQEQPRLAAAAPEPAAREDEPAAEPAPRRPAEPRLAARSDPPPRTAPSFNCRYAHSLSEEMVCSDPSLSAADRRLNRAYERAVAAGVPRRYLRAEQDDWLRIRELAARRAGPRAVADVYDQRIAELNDMAIEAQDEGY